MHRKRILWVGGENVSGEIRRDKLPQFAVGDGEFTSSAVQRWLSALEYIESGPLCAHFSWYTHRNPAGCWICDLATLVSVSVRQVRRLEEQLTARENFVGSVDRVLGQGGDMLENRMEEEGLNGEVPIKDLEKTSD